MTGQTVTHYRILEKLGEGGMGAVYKAEDIKLRRLVALKFLAPEHRERFLREAQAAAALNHPNICTIYEVDEEHGFLAMELVEGSSVSDRIRQRPLRIDEALDIATQACQGLQAAHERGVVHRDIKPSNLMVTAQGLVKIMDFGLAQIGERSKITKSGVSLGTPAYMSPEQAQGLTTDRRTDLWSIGVVLYEVIAGRAPFQGESDAALTSGILNLNPEPLTALRTGVPKELDRIVAKAMRKSTGDRYATAEDLLVDLRQVQRDPGELSGGAKRPWLKLAFAGLAILLLGIVSVWVISLRKQAAPSRVEYTQLTNVSDSVVSPALSPDGRMLTYIRSSEDFWGYGEVYVKLLPDGEPVRLTHDGERKVGPAVFSPDGSRIAYTVVKNMDWHTWTVPVLGGGKPTRMLTNAQGLTWIPAESGSPHVLFSSWTFKGPRMELYTSTESRSESRRIYLPDDVYGMVHRAFRSPDGTNVLIIEMGMAGWKPCRLIPFDGSSQGRVVGPQSTGAQCSDAAWSPDGRRMYFSANAGKGFHIWRQRFPDGEVEQVTSGPSEEEGIRFAPDGRSFVTAIGTSRSTLWLHDSKGERQITSEGFPSLPRISANGKRLYYLISPASEMFVRGAGQLWVSDLESNQREKLLPDLRMAYYDISSDGKRIVFVKLNAAGRTELWLAPVDGSSSPKRLTSLEPSTAFFGAAGEVVFAASEGEVKPSFLYRIKEDGTEPQKVTQDTVMVLYGVSPDGKWMATWEKGSSAAVYSADGGTRTALCSACGVGVSSETPSMVTWSPDGKFIYLHETGMRQTIALPLPKGKMLPALAAGGIDSPLSAMSLPGAQMLPQERAFGGPNPSMFSYLRVTTHRNIYRVPVR